MAKRITPVPKPSSNPRPSEPRHGGNKGRTTPKPPSRPVINPKK